MSAVSKSHELGGRLDAGRLSSRRSPTLPSVAVTWEPSLPDFEGVTVCQQPAL